MTKQERKFFIKNGVSEKEVERINKGLHPLYMKYYRERKALEHLGYSVTTFSRLEEISHGIENNSLLNAHINSLSKSPEDILIRKEEQARIHMAIKSLTAEDRKIIVSIYWFDNNESETASILDMSKRTVNYRHKRALKKIKIFLRENMSKTKKCEP